MNKNVKLRKLNQELNEVLGDDPKEPLENIQKELKTTATKLGQKDIVEKLGQVVKNGLESSKGPVELEDAEYETVVACVDAMKWSIMNRQIIEFVDYIKGVK